MERKAIGQIRFLWFLLELNIRAAMYLAMTLAYHGAGFGRLLVRTRGHGMYGDITQPLSYSTHSCLSPCVCHLFASFSLSFSVKGRCHNSNMYFTAYMFQNLGILIYLCSSQHNISQWPNTTQYNQVLLMLCIFLSLYKLKSYINREAWLHLKHYLSCKHTSFFWNIQILSF